jgi:hypothetical protein
MTGKGLSAPKIGPYGRWDGESPSLEWQMKKGSGKECEMYWLKACPRCGGDLHDEQDHYGEYLACIQCGFVPSTEQERALREMGSLEREMISLVRRAA